MNCIILDKMTEEERFDYLENSYKYNLDKRLKNKSIYHTIYRDLQHAIYNLVGNSIISYDTEDDTYIQFLIRILEAIDWNNLKEKLQHKFTKEILDSQRDITDTMKEINDRSYNSDDVKQLWRDLRAIIYEKTKIDINKFLVFNKECCLGNEYLVLVNTVYNLMDTNSFWWSTIVVDNLFGKVGDENNLNEAKKYLFDILTSEEKEKMKTRIEYIDYKKRIEINKKPARDKHSFFG